MMLRAILQSEVYRMLNGFTFRFSLLLLTALVPLSAYTQTLYYKQFVADVSARQKIHENENTYRSAVVVRSVPPLLPLFNGVYYYLPNEITLRVGSSVYVPSSDDLEPLDHLFPKADLSLMVGVLMTLMALLLGYDAIAGEREHGTLKLMLSFPVKKKTVLAAKLMGITFVMSISLLYVMGLYVVVVKAYGGEIFDLNAALLGELAILFLISLLLLAVFVALGVTASILTRQSTLALTGSAAAWAVLMFVWSSAAPYAVSSLRSMPTAQFAQRQLLNKESELIQAEMAEHRKLAAELEAQKIGREAAWRKYQELNQYWIEKKRDELARLTAAREGQIRGQQSAAISISLLSPYGAFSHALASICGTGLNDYNSFVDSVAAYEADEFAPASVEAMAGQKPWVRDSGKVEGLQIRAFQMTERPLSGRLAHAAPAVLSLLIQVQLLLVTSFVKFNRYDPR